MSSSSEILNSAKPNFSQTCNLLSRYLKQKGSLGDLTLGISNGKSENLTTMNLFPVVEKPMNLFPVVEKPMNSVNSIETKQPKRSQMTIFYNGQVIVFNDFPADKANDLMQLATKNNSPNLAPKLAPVKVVQKPPQPITPELQLPIARNASLHRFLEKRKDRIAAKAPYQINKSKNENKSSWLGLAAAQSSLQFGQQ